MKTAAGLLPLPEPPPSFPSLGARFAQATWGGDAARSRAGSLLTELRGACMKPAGFVFLFFRSSDAWKMPWHFMVCNGILWNQPFFPE
jgi:hypothetical protein